MSHKLLKTGQVKEITKSGKILLFKDATSFKKWNAWKAINANKK